MGPYEREHHGIAEESHLATVAQKEERECEGPGTEYNPHRNACKDLLLLVMSQHPTITTQASVRINNSSNILIHYYERVQLS